METADQEIARLKREVDNAKAEAEMDRERLSKNTADMEKLMKEHEGDMRRLKDIGGTGGKLKHFRL